MTDDFKHSDTYYEYMVREYPLIPIERMIQRNDELAEYHIEMQKKLMPESRMWCWHRDLGVNATRRAYYWREVLRTKYSDESS